MKAIQHWESSTADAKNKLLGFWLFLSAETVLFACLFGTYMALRRNTLGLIEPYELFDLNLVAIATLLLLTSSLTSALAISSMRRGQASAVMRWLMITFLFCFSFLLLEIYEFWHYVQQGHTMVSSAFGSAFYALVGTHGAHVLFGLCWLICIMIQLKRSGLNKETGPKVFVSCLYVHLLDVVWVFIFTIVYLIGKAQM